MAGSIRRATDSLACVRRDARGAEPSAGQVSDVAASGSVTDGNGAAAEDVADTVIAALQRRLGLEEAAAEAIVSGLRRRGAPQDGLAVYLDLNHWISLAKARVGRPDGSRFVPCLDLLVTTVGSGKVIVPLGLTHYTEVANIADVRQRADIANVMAILSGFTTLAARKERLRCEVAQALHQRLGRPLFPERLNPFGCGLAFALGTGNGPAGRIRPVGNAPVRVSEPFRAELEFRLNQVAEYLLLRGPAPEHLVAMPDYDLAAVRALVEARAAREQELFELLQTDAADMRRLGNIVHARGLYWDLGPQLPELLALAGLSVESFFYKGKDWITSFLDAIPALVVRTSLVMQTNRNGSRAWTRNDIYDIDALEAAVPYCDVVVTERYASEVINRSGAADRFSTKVIRRLDDLVPILQSLT